MLGDSQAALIEPVDVPLPLTGANLKVNKNKLNASLYQVEIPQFEGPLDLLLSLVDKEKLNITEISLAAVANQYRLYLETLDKLNLEIESSYIVVFAQLLEIKSRMLLPPVEEEIYDDFGGFSPADGFHDPEEDLVEQLRMYKLVKEAADWLAERETQGLAQYPHPVSAEDAEPEWLELDVSVESLAAAWIRLDTSLKAPRKAIELRRVEISVPERAQQIFTWVQKHTKGFFRQLFSEAAPKSYVVVSFLGLLELVRRSRVRATQMDWDADLEIELLSDEPFDLAQIKDDEYAGSSTLNVSSVAPDHKSKKSPVTRS